MADIHWFHLLYQFRSIIYTLVALIVLSRLLKKVIRTIKRSK